MKIIKEKMMLKKIMRTLCILLLPIFLFVGCSKEKEKTKSKEITFMIPEWGVPSEGLLNEFYDETGIKVNIETVAWDDIRNKISVAANGKKAAADVFEVDWSWVGEFKSAGWLEPIEISNEDKADILSITTFTINNEVLAIPYANDFRIGYYNKEVFEKNGLKEPKTWDEVEKSMLELKEKNILKYPYTLPLNATEGSTTAFIWLTYLRDGKVFNEDGSLNKENALTTLKYIDRMVKNKLINPANLNMKDIDTYREILSGEAVFLVGPTSFVERVNNEKQSKVIGKIAVIVPPGKEEKTQQTMALTEAIGVSKLSENKEEAKIFVKWYTSKKIQQRLYKDLSLIPTRTSILEELIKSGEIKNSGSMKETAQLVKSPFPQGVPSYYSEMSNAVSNNINKMASGNMTPEESLNEIDKKINQLIKK